MLEHLKHASPLFMKNRLTELTYFTTDTCNMKCRHCFVNEALNNRSPHLSLEEIRAMGAYIPAMQRVHLGGGEPFTRPEIGELATVISNEWQVGVVCIPTNGWFTDNILRGMRHFGENGRGYLRLHFSINSPDPAEMDNFTQLKGSFDRWRHSIEEALSLASFYQHITIVALATYNEYNQYKFIDLIDFLHDQVKVQDFSFHLVRRHGDYAPKLDIDHFRKVNAYYFRRWNKQNPLLSSFREILRERNADYFEKPVFQRPCTSGKIRVVMSPNGDVYPCEKLGYPNLRLMDSWKIGNIRDYDYDINKLVRSNRAVELYKKIVKTKCHCDHNIDQSMSLISDGSFRSSVINTTIRKYF